jgi:hypothetical protein
MPTLPAELIAQVSGLVAAYIGTQRDTYIHRAIPLTIDQRTAMARFFSPQLLDEVRLLVLNYERVANPDFYPMLERIGFNDLPDQSTMAAITFADCVVSHGPCEDVLLFHELVHVEQYRQLGVSEFADLYLRGYLSGGGTSRYRWNGMPMRLASSTRITLAGTSLWLMRWLDGSWNVDSDS